MLTPSSTAKKFRSRSAVIAGTALAIASAVVAAHTPADARGQHDSADAKNSATTTLTDQSDLNVTVYNSNIALVRDVRNLTLPTGNFRLKFEDIAATVNPATVHFRSLTDPAAVGLIIALITESGTPSAFNLFNPSTLVSKLSASPAALIARIFAMITSSVSPSCAMLITSSFVNLFLTAPLSCPKAAHANAKHTTDTKPINLTV